MGIGDWGLGIGDWGLGPIPHPQYPNPKPPNPFFPIKKNSLILLIKKLNFFFKIIKN